MDKEKLKSIILLKKSFLCIGLDPNLDFFPKHLLKEKDPIFLFNKKIIDATKDYCVSYKINLAFFERYGEKGIISLRKTLDYIPKNIFIIADGKRGDIFHSSKMYAESLYEEFNFHAATLNPYMGEDAITPFQKKGKWSIILSATSNPSSRDFQMIKTEKGIPLYLEVVNKAKTWGTPNNIMFVVGGTNPEVIKKIRHNASNFFFLVPGFGTQGGDLDKIFQAGNNKDIGLLVNCSRKILYANDSVLFDKYSGQVAFDIQRKMEHLLQSYNFISN